MRLRFFAALQALAGHHGEQFGVFHLADLDAFGRLGVLAPWLQLGCQDHVANLIGEPAVGDEIPWPDDKWNAVVTAALNELTPKDHPN